MKKNGWLQRYYLHGERFCDAFMSGSGDGLCREKTVIERGSTSLCRFLWVTMICTPFHWAVFALSYLMAGCLVVCIGCFVPPLQALFEPLSSTGQLITITVAPLAFAFVVAVLFFIFGIPWVILSIVLPHIKKKLCPEIKWS